MIDGVRMENIITMEQLHHEHPLQLIDMQPTYPHYEEEYDADTDNDDDDDGDGGREDDLSPNWDFHHPCNRCGQVINFYHRYYYKCKGSCDYWLHKFCGEIPTKLKHRSHRAQDHHSLTLGVLPYLLRCEVCKKYESSEVFCYRCRECDVGIHVKCIMAQEENHPIYHPSHPHPLVSVTSEPILCNCDACGKKHMGIFYHCITCLSFPIHSDCAFLPKSLPTHHTHPLTLTYSFLNIDQSDRFYPRCRICRVFFYNENLWIYKCEKCRYYAHLDCATSRGEPFMSIVLSPGLGKTVKNFEDADHPGLLNLPFPDQAHDILRHLFFKESGHTTLATNEGNLNHISHEHMLTMVGTHSGDMTMPNSSSNNLLSCHNPMKKIELLCNGCIRPIMNMPFYKCANENEGCSFVIHEWCTRLPHELLNYPGHPHHTLSFLPNVTNSTGEFINVFRCACCHLYCNGFAYGCVECKYYIDVTCAFIPEKLTHGAHPGHLLSRVVRSSYESNCFACQDTIYNIFAFNCRTCDFNLHPECALLLPSVIMHRLDKHPLKLSYLPIENHKSEYFCIICEEKLDPNIWFYHCDVCVESIHTSCCSLIIECERAINRRNVFYYLNVKFGGIHDIKGHPHSLLFAQGIKRDGTCSHCFQELRNSMIFKCLECKFVIHYRCMHNIMRGLSHSPPRTPLLLNN